MASRFRKWRKPAAWTNAAGAVILETGNQCEACGAKHLTAVFRSANGRIATPSETELVDASPGQWAVVQVEVIPIDGNYRNTRRSNLIALCLVCRNKYRHRHRQTCLKAIQTDFNLPVGAAEA